MPRMEEQDSNISSTTPNKSLKKKKSSRKEAESPVLTKLKKRNSLDKEDCEIQDAPKHSPKKKKKLQEEEINSSDVTTTPTTKKKKNKTKNNNEEVKDKMETEGPVNDKRLHVNNLAPGTTRDDLTTHFPTASLVILPRLKFKKQKAKFAFVEFATESEAQAAMAEKQGSELRGGAITLQYAAVKSGGSTSTKTGGETLNTGPCLLCRGEAHLNGVCPQTEKKNLCTVYVGNLDTRTTEDELRSHLSGVNIIEVRFPLTASGQKRGFAFVEVESPSEVTSIVAEKKDSNIRGRVLKLEAVSTTKKHDKNEAPKKAHTLCVKNLDRKTTEADLTSHFSGATSVRIPNAIYKNGAKKSVAFVEFASTEEAQRMLTKLQGHKLRNNKLKIQFVHS